MSMHKDPTKAQTRDIGLAIRDAFEYEEQIFIFNEENGELIETNELRDVSQIDASDPDNLLVVLDNGQRFRVRITSEG